MANKKITDLQLRTGVTDDLNLPSDDGIQSYRITALQLWNYIFGKTLTKSYEVSNLTLATSVGSSALTIAVKTKANGDASASDTIRVGFRSSTLTSGLYLLREVSSALNLTISSGSTLGQVSGQPSYIWVYLIDNAGTVELAASHKFYPEDALVTTTAEGGAGAADSATAIYSTAARTNVAVRCIGYVLNTQATAGTWASAGSKIQLLPIKRSNVPTVTQYTSGTGTHYTAPGCTRMRVRMVGGGGGGGGGGVNGGTNDASTAGGDTTWGSLTAGGGGRGQQGGQGPVGGVNTFSGTGFEIPGGAGGSFAYYTGGGINIGGAGGMGGNSYFGGGGFSGYATGGGGGSGATNSGAGGGGGGAGSSGGTACSSGAGGGAGGYIEAYIDGPVASYSYGVGAEGNPASGATAGGGGGSGGRGIIIVEEFFD